MKKEGFEIKFTIMVLGLTIFTMMFVYFSLTIVGGYV